MYLYANANPLRYTDPDGLEAVIPLPGVGPGAAGGTSGGVIGACLAHPLACAAVGGAGAADYGVGGFVYPHIAGPLGDALDKMCSDDAEEDCKEE